MQLASNALSASLSATTTKPSIIDDIDFLVGTDTTSFPLADKLRLINLHYYDAVTYLLSIQNNWEWDDTNKTDFPIGTTDLVADQQSYTLPTDMVRLSRVEVLNTNGQYSKLLQFDESQVPIALSNLFTTSGTPLYYREFATGIELYPSPAADSVTLTAGLKIYFQRLPTLFTTADWNVSPGFDALYHRILSLGPAYDFAVAKGLPSQKGLLQKIIDLKAMMSTTYSKRNREIRPIIRVPLRSYN